MSNIRKMKKKVSQSTRKAYRSSTDMILKSSTSKFSAMARKRSARTTTTFVLFALISVVAFCAFVPVFPPIPSLSSDSDSDSNMSTITLLSTRKLQLESWRLQMTCSGKMDYLSKVPGR